MTHAFLGAWTAAHLPNQFEDLWFLAFALLHALLHGGDDRVRLVLGAVLGALFGGSCSFFSGEEMLCVWGGADGGQ